MIALCDMIVGEENKSKFNRIYERYKNTMYSVAYDIMKNSHDAEDIVEDTLIKVIGILDSIDAESIGTARCKNLMITISKNLAIDYWRKMKREPIPIGVETRESYKDAEELYIDMENYKDLINCIDELDEKYRDVLNLKSLHHLSSKQIGNLLNISEINVNMRYMRAKNMLAKRLKERRRNE